MTEPATPAPPPKPPRSRVRRVLRGIAIAVLVLVIVVALAPVIVWKWVTSASGGAWLRAQVLSAAADNIEGRVEVDRVSLSGLVRLELEGVRLYAPGDTEPVASMARVVVDVRATALAAKRLELSEVSVEKPVVHIVPEGATTNLQRALKPKKPAAPKAAEPAKGPTDFVVYAPDVRISDGSLRMDGPSPVAAEDLDLQLALNGTLEKITVSSKLSLHALEPLDRRAELSLQARYLGDRVEIASLGLATGESHLGLKGEAALNASSGHVEIEDAHLAAEDVNALAPQAKLLGDVALTGNAAFDRTSAKAHLVAQLPSGAVEIGADAHLAPPDSQGFLLGYTAEVHVRGVDVEKVVDGLPRAHVVADLSVKGSGMPPNGTADVVLDASKSRYESLPIDVAKISLKTKGMAADITSLHLAAAGASVTGSGTADAKAAQLTIDASVPDLAKTRAALASGLKIELPEMTGSVHLAGKTGGTYAAPQGTFTIEVPNAAAEGNSVRDFAGVVTLDRLSPPAGSITAGRIGAFEAAGVQGRQLRFGLRLDGQALRVDLDGELAGPPGEVAEGTPPPAPQFLPVGLSVRAEREAPPERGIERWTLHQFAASALGLSLASETDATLEYGRGGVKVDGLVLGGDFGRIALTGASQADGSFDAALTIDRLTLEKLPEAVLPKALGLAGTLAGSATASGTAAHPVAKAKLRLVEGSYRALAPVAGEIEAGLVDKTASAKLSLALPLGGRAGISAVVPVTSPTSPVKAGETVEASLFLDSIDLGLAQRFDSTLPPVTGKLSGALQLSGTWAAPVTDGTFRIDDAAGFGLDGLAVTFGYAWKESKATASLTAKRAGTLDVRADAAFPLVAAEVLAGKVPDFKALPVETNLVLTQLDLSWLARAGFAPEELAGRIAGKARATGTLAAPHVDGTFQASAVRMAGYQDVSAVLDVDGRDQVTAKLQASIGAHETLAADLALAVAPGKLAALTTDDWLDVPVKFEARLLPTSVHKLLPQNAPNPGEEPPPYQANVAGRLTFSGSASKPEAHFHAVIDQLLVSGQKMGSAAFDMDSAGAKTTFGGSFVSRDAGTFDMKGQLAGSLGARELAELGRARLVQKDPAAKPTLGEALAASADDVMSRKLDFVASSEQFDLAVANGFVPGVRDIAGRLDLKLEKHGPLSKPDVTGKLAMTGGRAAVVEFGRFDDVKLDLELAWPTITLRDFSGKSGTGTFAMNAKSGAGAQGGYVGEVHASVDALPLVQNYQTRGYLTLNADATDITWKDSALNVPKLVLSKGLLKIPERPQKVVQSLDPHPDIVFAGAQKKVEEPAKLGWRATVGIQIPDDFNVDAPLGNSLVLGANLTAKLDDALNRDGKGPFDLTGKIRLPRGKLSILQARFDVRPQSSITLFPRQWDNPTLDITAVYEKQTASGPIEVTATFTGTVQNMARNFTSKPPMDEAEIVYFIATGQRQQRAQTDPFALNKESLDDTLVGLVGSIGSSFAKSFLQKYIGAVADLDVLSVDTRGNTQVGTYLWNGRLYFGGQWKPNANTLAGENTAELKAEYRISDKAFGRLRVGDQSRSGVEILYQDSVPAESQKRSDQP